MTTKITEQNISNLANLGVQWQAVVTASTLNAAVGKGYFIDTTSNACTITITASGSATAGDTIVFKDYARNWGTNAITFASNKFDGVDSRTPSFSTTGQTVTLVHMGSTKGWSLINEDTTTGLGETFIAATGGTITTSGNFKIHSFTGDSNFVVSQAPGGGAPGVDYLVVAGAGGGGGDGGGGGGAGGFRMSNSTCMPAPLTSPLTSPSGLAVTAQTYPITVGGGGTAGRYSPAPSTVGGDGSNSVFSTITSAGGGGGGAGAGAGGNDGRNGGSGGGSTRPGSTGGSGNTPPVSPPQGNNGSSAGPSPNGNGGGGAGVAGQANPGPSQGGRGGDGSYASTCIAVGCAGVPHTDIPASNPPSVSGAKYFAGGGGGGGDGSPAPGNYGGLGGGGIGGDRPSGSNAGTGQANTGGGGGGAGVPGNAGAGGKGIVIIRYKFQ